MYELRGNEWNSNFNYFYIIYDINNKKNNLCYNYQQWFIEKKNQCVQATQINIANSAVNGYRARNEPYRSKNVINRSVPFNVGSSTFQGL